MKDEENDVRNPAAKLRIKEPTTGRVVCVGVGVEEGKGDDVLFSPKEESTT